ncbi:5188_t:CDS:2, partial [Diversispora eburnea]
TSLLVEKMGKQLNIQSQEIIDKEMANINNGKNKDNNLKGKGTDISEGSNKRPIEVNSEELNITQDKSLSKKQRSGVWAI